MPQLPFKCSAISEAKVQRNFHLFGASYRNFNLEGIVHFLDDKLRFQGKGGFGPGTKVHFAPKSSIQGGNQLIVALLLSFVLRHGVIVVCLFLFG
jgi:hypothetical protein